MKQDHTYQVCIDICIIFKHIRTYVYMCNTVIHIMNVYFVHAHIRTYVNANAKIQYIHAYIYTLTYIRTAPLRCNVPFASILQVSQPKGYTYGALASACRRRTPLVHHTREHP